MTDDMTFQEIAKVKSDIKEFLDKIQNICIETAFDFEQCDSDFFSFIAKHIVFFKFMESDGDMYSYKVLISDFYYFIMVIIKSEIRYIYVNERSIIENYLRTIMRIYLQDNHVTVKVFEELSKKAFNCTFTSAEYSLIKSQYVTACEFIHGGNILNDNLAYVLDECANSIFPVQKRRKYYDRLQRILKIFDRLLVAEYPQYISGRFHRRKSLLQYLIGLDKVNLLFSLVN